jgi:hypothetical protein
MRRQQHIVFGWLPVNQISKIISHGNLTQMQLGLVNRRQRGTHVLSQLNIIKTDHT